ncbi:MAG: hypothetical protein ACREO3_04935, partial [Arenimonas sp.]
LQALRGQWQRQPAPTAPRPQAFAPAPISEAPAPRVIEASGIHVAPVVASTSPGALGGRGFRIAALFAAALAIAAVLSRGWWASTPAPVVAESPQVVALSTDPTGAPVPLSPVTHPDYALVAGADDVALAEDLDLLSWIAAGADAAPAATPGAAP